MLMRPEDRIRDHLHFLYGPGEGERAREDLNRRLAAFKQRNPHLTKDVPPPAERLTERDSFVITYGDQIADPDRPPLQTLADFFDNHLGDAVRGIHILPHFPYSSDDGFSVIDYRQVDPKLGEWSDVARLGKNHRLMFDGVINHISRLSKWFDGFIHNRTSFADYFIECDPQTDLSGVVRPRALPLLTPVETDAGRKHVWTTFSDDQIDLNFRNPQVLLEIIDVLLFYVEQGAEVIRLDAIAYLWKEIGTSCIHLPQTHCVVKLFRAVLDVVAPGVMLITETNVPHPDNISYFGDGTDEAQMVYNFALPPLVLHTFRTGNVSRLSAWAGTLQTPSTATTFFNFIASHDGIGVMPARGLLSKEEISALVEHTLEHGGKVSYKSNADGTQSPYELNITLFDALNAETDSMAVDRFLASQAIMLSLAGVPGIYVHSLFGSRNWHDGVAQTGRARTINRQKFGRAALAAALADRQSLKSRVFNRYRELLRIRNAHPAFHPNGIQEILDVGEGVFACRRTAPDASEAIVALVNVTDKPKPAAVAELGAECHDLISGKRVTLSQLAAYQCLWLRAP